jgi:NAD(P)-dependent dehydrogenase (short-subunit alcohol dehydrogenase family)
LVDQTEANYRKVFDVNVMGVLAGLKYEIRAMQARGGGAIVNISSVGGQIGLAGAAIYAASKCAIDGLTRSAALETAKLGIRVNAVAPGAIETPMMHRLTDTDPRIHATLVAAHPVGRTGLPADVAGAVLYLASDDAKFTTGSILTVDGGYTVQ